MRRSDTISDGRRNHFVTKRSCHLLEDRFHHEPLQPRSCLDLAHLTYGFAHRGRRASCTQGLLEGTVLGFLVLAVHKGVGHGATFRELLVPYLSSRFKQGLALRPSVA